uniref:Membrane protein n=1 Tax=Erwinia phage Fifi051 TaxID=3238787 RepID=A0AB39ACK4_9CAUD
MGVLIDMGSFLKLYFLAMVLIIVTLVLWGFVLPQAVSSPDTLSVFLGFAGAIVWVGICVWLFYRQFRKFKKCVKY